jgi:hypothetical protein
MPAAMLHDFLADLIERGRVTVALAIESTPEQFADLESRIRRLDAESRLDLAFTPPALSIDAAVWALEFIENACRFLVYRELDEAIMTDRLAHDCPGQPSVDRAYSVDLLMRYLPDVSRMAKGVGESDPLVKHLQQAGARWPLSSVGMAGIACDTGELDLILKNACLRQLYVDRIIQRTDISLLGPAAVRDAVTSALGVHPSLAPEIARAIENAQEKV